MQRLLSWFGICSQHRVVCASAFAGDGTHGHTSRERPKTLQSLQQLHGARLSCTFESRSKLQNSLYIYSRAAPSRSSRSRCVHSPLPLVHILCASGPMGSVDAAEHHLRDYRRPEGACLCLQESRAEAHENGSVSALEPAAPAPLRVDPCTHRQPVRYPRVRQTTRHQARNGAPSLRPVSAPVAYLARPMIFADSIAQYAGAMAKVRMAIVCDTVRLMRRSAMILAGTPSRAMSAESLMRLCGVSLARGGSRVSARMPMYGCT